MLNANLDGTAAQCGFLSGQLFDVVVEVTGEPAFAGTATPVDGGVSDETPFAADSTITTFHEMESRAR